MSFTDTHVILEKLALSKRKKRQGLNAVRLAEQGRIPVNVSYTNPRVTYDGINWWISVGIEADNNPQPATNPGIGIDVGVKELAVTNEGKVYRNINKDKKVRKLKKRQRRLQRKISRKYENNKKGESYQKTRNIIKSERKLLKLNHRLNGIRQNHVHQATSEITKQKPRFIVMEDLNIKGMMKNKHLSKAIQEQGLYEFHRQIAYKSNWNGITHIETSRYYPSSKTCSVCGLIKTDLKLSDRIYRCECGNVIDRDLNAAINLKAYVNIA